MDGECATATAAAAAARVGKDVWLVLVSPLVMMGGGGHGYAVPPFSMMTG